MFIVLDSKRFSDTDTNNTIRKVRTHFKNL